ncbi:RNA metabolism protein [Lithospermum erythrorhizon]|uniref:RNA metabolism protein n=1 Tax=Lithospermum erythrorhizon TaxID=34254 RepID=A0AAV3NJS6_LITER
MEATSVELTPSKRPHEETDAEENGKEKLQKSEGLNNSPLKILPKINVIRVLCPISRIDSVIGDDGISQIRQQFGVDVEVEEIASGCDETVILICGLDKDNEMGIEKSNVEGGDAEMGLEKSEIDGFEADKTEKSDKFDEGGDEMGSGKSNFEGDDADKNEKSDEFCEKDVEMGYEKSNVDGFEADRKGKCEKFDEMDAEMGTEKSNVDGGDAGMVSGKSKVDGFEADKNEKSEKSVENDAEMGSEKKSNVDGNDAGMGPEKSKVDGFEVEKSEKLDENDDNEEKKKELVSIEKSGAENKDEAIDKALLFLFKKMVGQAGMNGGGEVDDKAQSHVMRLIVFSSQVSSLLGKNGGFIKKMSNESGAEIKILPRDKLPLCASSADDLVQISGELDAVRKALQSVCKQLREGFSNQDILSDVQPLRDSSHPSSRQDKSARSDHSFRCQGPLYAAGFRDGERGFPTRMNPPDVLAFHLLCPAEKVGGLIGKGGTIVNALQHETGCEIKVLEGVAGSDDRVIAISGPAHPEDRISAAQDAVLRVHSRIVRAGPDSNEGSVTAKLLVSSNQIGCLLGKGGAIITDMRKSSGAFIRILGKDVIPKNAAENEEVVQINGEPQAVHKALMQITARLQDRFFRDAFSSNHAFPDQMTPFSSFRGRRGFSPPGMYHNMGPPSLGGLRPRGGHQLDGRPPFAHDFRSPGIPDKMPSSTPWGPQQGMVDGDGPMGFPDYRRAPARRIGGFGGENHPATITSTTMEVVVPYSVVPAIYGEGGGCLRQIREISDAKITIADTKPGATETVIIISGTPEQTNAAQSLIQAFVISETEVP